MTRSCWCTCLRCQIKYYRCRNCRILKNAACIEVPQVKILKGTFKILYDISIKFVEFNQFIIYEWRLLKVKWENLCLIRILWIHSIHPLFSSHISIVTSAIIIVIIWMNVFNFFDHSWNSLTTTTFQCRILQWSSWK